MKKAVLASSAICLLFPAAGAQRAAAGPYWGVNGTSYTAPYIAPPYTCVTNYYVAPNGSDSNNGTSSAPWKTISRAIAVLSNGSPQGGVCVNAAPGTYTESLYISQLSGTADAPTGYLVFRSQNLHAATLQEPLANIASYAGNAVIQNASFIIFDGFNVTGYPYIAMAGADGFQVLNSHHIKFLNNIVHDVGGAGIASIYSDYVSAYGNVIYDTACCDSSGVSAIDYFEPVASDNNPGFHNVVSSNIIFNNAEGADGRSPHTEGHGIALDRFRNGPSGSYPGFTLIENNLIYNNGGAGIILYYSNNVTMRNNTVFDNFRDPLITAPAGDISVLNSSYVTGVNNIAVSNPTTNSRILSIWDQTWDKTNIGNVWANNLTFNGTPGQPATGLFAKYNLGTPITAANGNILGADPMFTNPPMGIFSLSAASPGIGKGTNAYGVPASDLPGNIRPAATDIGAFAFNPVPPS